MEARSSRDAAGDARKHSAYAHAHSRSQRAIRSPRRRERRETRPYHAKPDQTKPDQTIPRQTRPDRLNQTTRPARGTTYNLFIDTSASGGFTAGLFLGTFLSGLALSEALGVSVGRGCAVLVSAERSTTQETPPFKRQGDKEAQRVNEDGETRPHYRDTPSSTTRHDPATWYPQISHTSRAETSTPVK